MRLSTFQHRVFATLGLACLFLARTSCAFLLRGTLDDSTPKSLVMLLRGSMPGDCTFSVLNYTSGAVVNVASMEWACSDRNENLAGFPVAAFSPKSEAIYYSSGTGTRLHVVDANTGASQNRTVLPTRTETGFIIGLTVHPTTDAVYLVSVNALYQLMGTELKNVANLSHLKLSQDSIVTSNTDPTWSGITVLDPDTGSAYTIRLTDFDILHTSLPSPVSHTIDIQYDSIRGSFIALADYKLYAANLLSTTPSAKLIMDIPDGDGYPRINTLDGNTFSFSDFDNVYTLDVATGTILTKAPFNGYFVRGAFFFYEPKQQ